MCYVRLFAGSTHRPGAIEREQVSGDPRMGPKASCKCGAYVYLRTMRGGQCYECYVRGLFHKGAR